MWTRFDLHVGRQLRLRGMWNKTCRRAHFLSPGFAQRSLTYYNLGLDRAVAVPYMKTAGLDQALTTTASRGRAHTLLCRTRGLMWVAVVASAREGNPGDVADGDLTRGGRRWRAWLSPHRRIKMETLGASNAVPSRGLYSMRSGGPGRGAWPRRAMMADGNSGTMRVT